MPEMIVCQPCCGETKCCDGCVDCSCYYLDPNDVIITVTRAGMPCMKTKGCEGDPVAFAGSRVVGPCLDGTAIGEADCHTKYRPSARVKMAVVNNTQSDIKISFTTRVAGLRPEEYCTLKMQRSSAAVSGCGSPVAEVSLPAGDDVPWFHLCIAAGLTVTVCLHHRVDGDALPCCLRPVTIDNWKYKVKCVSNTDCTDADCSFSPGKQSCCDCCCVNDPFFRYPTGHEQECYGYYTDFQGALEYPECDGSFECETTAECAAPETECADMYSASGVDCGGACSVLFTRDHVNWSCECVYPGGGPPITTCNPTGPYEQFPCHYTADPDCKYHDSWTRTRCVDL